MKTVDLGTFEAVGFAEIIDSGKSREEVVKDAKRIAKKLGIKINIKYVDEFPAGMTVYDTRTGRVSLTI